MIYYGNMLREAERSAPDLPGTERSEDVQVALEIDQLSAD